MKFLASLILFFPLLIQAELTNFDKLKAFVEINFDNADYLHRILSDSTDSELAKKYHYPSMDYIEGSLDAFRNIKFYVYVLENPDFLDALQED